MTALNQSAKRRKRIVSERLVREEWDGKRFYYQGYKAILTKKKSPEEIMGSSVLQSLLVSLIMFYLREHLNRSAYWVVGGESGLHLAKRKNMANDIAVYRKTDVPDLFSENYFNVPPILVGEVDIKIELPEGTNEMDFIIDKTQQLLDFGVETVFWVTTKMKKVVVAYENQPWQIVNWTDDILLMDGQVLNIEKLLQDEGVY